jgi:hypothetical protein
MIANKPMVMSKLFISKYLDLSLNTVNKYITQSLPIGKPIEEIMGLSYLELEKLFIEQPIRVLFQHGKEAEENRDYHDHDVAGIHRKISGRLHAQPVIRTLWEME